MLRDCCCLIHELSWVWLTPENTTCSLDDDGDSPQLAPPTKTLLSGPSQPLRLLQNQNQFFLKEIGCSHQGPSLTPCILHAQPRLLEATLRSRRCNGKCSWLVHGIPGSKAWHEPRDKTPALQAPAEVLSDSDTYEGVQPHTSLFFSISSSPFDHVDIAV